MRQREVVMPSAHGAMSAMSKRHTRIQVEPGWVDQVEVWRRERGLSHEALGDAAGLSQSTVSRALAGKVTVEAAEALARLTGIPVPHVLVAEERHQIWMEYGQRLDHIAPRLFVHELADLRTLVETLEARQRRRVKSTT
jgi:transcriptional regulator with XRE-family HTH domain